jgi:hypothetical protein
MNAILRLDQLPVANKIETVKTVVICMTGNPNFPTPSPALTIITSANNALETAYLAAQHGGKDTTANMHAKEEALNIQVKLLMAYVTSIAEANPASAEAIILSAGMQIKGKGGRTLVSFAVDALKEAGKIRIMIKFVARATFHFQMSTAPGDESSWQTIYEGTQAKFIKAGLTSGTRYFFRAAVIDKNGRSSWTEPMSSIAL